MKRLFRDLALMIIAATFLRVLFPKRFAVNVGLHASIHGYAPRPAAGGFSHLALRERLAWCERRLAQARMSLHDS